MAFLKDTEDCGPTKPIMRLGYSKSKWHIVDQMISTIKKNKIAKKKLFPNRQQNKSNKHL